MYSSYGITPIASPSNVIPCPEKEIIFTLKGLFPLAFLFLKMPSNFCRILSLKLI
jgi:hypothetical protein